MEREGERGERPRRTCRAAAEEPPREHGQRTVELSAVLVAHEGNERIRREAREGEEDVIVADERRRQEERERDDGACRRGDEPRGPRPMPVGARKAHGASGIWARRSSSGVLTFVNE